MPPDPSVVPVLGYIYTSYISGKKQLGQPWFTVGLKVYQVENLQDRVFKVTVVGLQKGGLPD